MKSPYAHDAGADCDPLRKFAPGTLRALVQRVLAKSIQLRQLLVQLAELSCKLVGALGFL